MTLFLIGLAGFIVPHIWSALRTRAEGRDVRKRIGEARYLGFYSLLSLFFFVLMIIGYVRAPQGVPLWTGPEIARTLALPLNMFALALVAAAYTPTGYLKRVLHHPMMIGTLVWALSHLWVGGDWAKVLLMSAFALYAVISVLAAISRGERVTKTPSLKGDLIALALGLGVAALMIFTGHGAYR